jgi:phosphate:Na+ symporter
MKDISNNIQQLSRSSKALKFDFFLNYQLQTLNLFRKLVHWLSHAEKPSYQDLMSIYNLLVESYQNELNRFYKEASDIKLQDMEITTLLNFHREGFSANRALLMAVKDWVLDQEAAKAFNEEPSFIS